MNLQRTWQMCSMFFSFQMVSWKYLKNNIYRVGFPTHENFKPQTQYVVKVSGGCCVVQSRGCSNIDMVSNDEIELYQYSLTRHAFIYIPCAMSKIFIYYICVFVGKSKFGITISSCGVLCQRYLYTTYCLFIENQILD